MVGNVRTDPVSLLFDSSHHSKGSMAGESANLDCICNGTLFCEWEKMKKGKERFTDAINKSSEQEVLIDQLFDILCDTEESEILPENTLFSREAEAKFSSIFVFPFKVPDRKLTFGTISSTILLVDHENQATFIEQNWNEFFMKNNIENKEDFHRVRKEIPAEEIRAFSFKINGTT